MFYYFISYSVSDCKPPQSSAEKGGKNKQINESNQSIFYLQCSHNWKLYFSSLSIFILSILPYWNIQYNLSNLVSEKVFKQYHHIYMNGLWPWL